MMPTGILKYGFHIGGDYKCVCVDDIQMTTDVFHQISISNDI